VTPNYTAVALGDVEGDGYLDIFAYQGPQPAIFWNRTEGEHIGTNTFPRVVITGVLGTGVGPFADVNGDGRPDILATFGYNANRTAATPGVITSESFAAGSTYAMVQGLPKLSADLNGDGAQDFVLPPRGNILFVLENVCDSAPAINRIAMTSGQLQVRVLGLPMQRLQLESSFDLKGWSRSGSSVQIGASGEMDVTVSPTGSRRFYRLPSATNVPPRAMSVSVQTEETTLPMEEH
jgi:hypothetical protein